MGETTNNQLNQQAIYTHSSWYILQDSLHLHVQCPIIIRVVFPLYISTSACYNHKRCLSVK